MSSLLQKVSGLLILLVIVSACARTQPVYNVEEQAVPKETQQKISSSQVGDIIAKSAISKGWLVDKVKPGLLRCTIKWREHEATADITYTKHSYNIELDSSTNLLESEGMIHKNYNHRVELLQLEIDNRLSDAAYN